MKHNKTMIVGVLLFCLQAMAASNPAKLTGTVKDKDTGEPLPFANVIVYQYGNELAKSISDFEGNFILPAFEKGKYDISASYVGYNIFKMTGVDIQATLKNGISIEMKPNAIDLDEIVVTVDRTLRDSHCCCHTSTTVCWLSSITEEVEETEDQVIEYLNSPFLEVYPNPSSGRVNFRVTNSGDLEDLIILDMSGRVVNTTSLNSNTTELDLSYLSPGTYLAKMGSEENLLVERFMIVK